MFKYVLYTLLIVTTFSSCQRVLRAGGAGLPTGRSSGRSAPTGQVTNLIKEAGIRRYFVNVDGDNRTFLVQLPKGYDPSQTYPVIFFFHSINGRDTGWLKNRGINEYVDKYKYIAVYGQGANGGIWNIGGYYPLKKVSEPNYVQKMWDWLRENTKVDSRRVYAVGTSNGALLAHYLAVEMNLFAAIVPISGSLYTGEMNSGAQPVAVLQVHGTQDKTIPYEGGFTKHQYDFLSAQNSVQTWAQVNGCAEKPNTSNLLGGKVVAYTYTNCKTNKPAILYSVPGGPHKVMESLNSEWLFEQVFDFLAKNSR